MMIGRLAFAKKTALIICVLVVTAISIFLSQMYFTHMEARELSNRCYDDGRFPKLEKTALSIQYFDCERK